MAYRPEPCLPSWSVAWQQDEQWSVRREGGLTGGRRRRKEGGGGKHDQQPANQ